jgi:hypothetical protein
MGLAMSLNLDIDSLPPEQVEAAITRLEAMKAQRATENKLAHYRPYPKQVAFHAAGVRCRERLLIAANQSGKSLAGAMECAMDATGRYPDWWKGRRFDSQRSAGVDFKPMSGTPPETWAFHDQRIPRYERDIINMVGMGVTENAALKPKREGRRRGLLGDLCPRQDWQRRGAGGGGLDVERVNCACQTATQGTCRRVPARADDGPAPRRRWSASQAIPMEHPLSGVERDRQHVLCGKCRPVGLAAGPNDPA